MDKSIFIPFAVMMSLIFAFPAMAHGEDAGMDQAESVGANAQADARSGLRSINPAELSKPMGYSHVVAAPAGTLLYVSGQMPVDKAGNLVGYGDPGAQAEQVFANLKTALEAAGASFDDVVKLNMYVTDISRIAALRTARDKYIDPKNPPASTLVEVKRLVKEGVMVEIDAVAVVPDSRQR